MTWTYGAAPATSNRDWVRLRVGDTDTTDQLLADSEVDGLLSVYTSKFKAAAACAKAIAARFSRKADTTMGQLSVSHSQKAAAYLVLAAEIEAGIGLDAGRVTSIAISVAARDTEEDDEDRPAPAFTMDTFGTDST